ncbi:MAG: FAD-dependent monooxygenase [Cyanobacteria bacterium P01_H01_bin.21]
MVSQKLEHAIVIGGSIAGLFAAKVVSEVFHRVTLIERDSLPQIPQPRRGVPQSVQPHVLFTRGFQIMEQHFPGLGEALATAGAVTIDWGREFHLFSLGGWNATFDGESQLQSVTCSRYLLETVIRQQVAKLPNVQFLDGCKVQGLVMAGSAIQGVRYQRLGDSKNTTLTAQLVVDASGRGSAAPHWLQQLGVTPPPQTRVDGGLGYATRRYQIPDSAQPDCKVMLIGHEPPDQPRLGYLAQIENDQWIATLGGYGKQYPPLDTEGFLAFAQTLEQPHFYQAICNAEPCSDIMAHRATANRLYHYEKIALPSGFVALGDAVCALCPVYGQGMTVSALSSLVLQRWLAEVQAHEGDLDGTTFQKQLARSNASPWSLATMRDSGFAFTQGAIESKGLSKVMGKVLLGYIQRLLKQTQQDGEMHLRMMEMAHLLRSPASLFHPQIVGKVFFN